MANITPVEPVDKSIIHNSETKSMKSSERKRKLINSESIHKPAKKVSKSNFIQYDEIDTEARLNKAISTMDSQLLSDYIAQLIKKHESYLSSIELEDKYIRATSITDTTSWNKVRNLENLPGFLERFSGNVKKLWSAPKKNGTPHTIIVAGSGLRAADIVRSVRNFPEKEVKVAKLFAKHIKIQDAIKFLNFNRVGIVIGTPQRIRDLIENGALVIDRLERIVIDASHIDQKKRGILEMKETLSSLMMWLSQKNLRDKYCAGEDGIKLLFY